jgi:hypothetical protein
MVDSLIGKTLGKYQIVELIGRGAMAEVYKAYQPGLDRYVAIKLMHSFLAEEWVADWYSEDYYAGSSVSQNPYGPASGAVKVLRGGSWSANRWGARCASRLYGNRKATRPEVGFRCAMFTLSKPR